MPVTFELSHCIAVANALMGIGTPGSSRMIAIDCWNESPSSVMIAIRRGLSSRKIRQTRLQASWAGAVTSEADAGMAQR